MIDSGRLDLAQTAFGWYDNFDPDQMHIDAMIEALKNSRPLSVEEIEKLRPHRSPEQIERMYEFRNLRLAEIAAEEAAKKDKKGE